MRIAVPAVAGLITVCAILLAGGGAWPDATPADASFHLMRVHAVTRGFMGNTTTQYVELRMAAGGQTQVSGHNLCFFDPSGDPWARFTFPSNVLGGASGSSILVGSPGMDALWPGAPDFVFGPGNTVGFDLSASPSSPVYEGSGQGKVAFGSDSATEPAEMCGSQFSVIDSVAYGAGYTGPVDFGTQFGSDVPFTGMKAVKLTNALCNPCARDNSIDYSIVELTDPADYPRNNSGETAPIGDGGTPTPTPEPSPFGTPTPSPTPFVPPPQGLQGDVTCDFALTSVDALGDLRYVAGLPQITQHEPCADIGAEVPWGVQGDVNCDNGAVTAVDALGILRYLAGLPPISQHEPCPDVGTTV